MRRVGSAVVCALLSVLALAAGSASAAPLEWRLEPVKPPPLPGETAEEHERRLPIGLGSIGDIEFLKPNLGLLITAGNPPSVPPGVWAYDGVSWRPLTGEGPNHNGICGATDGRIAWASETEFWTISDGRPGQISEHGAPLADNTLCHFAVPAGSEPAQVVGSYASLAFRPDSYQAMHAAGCISRNDCWFAGDPLPEGQVGAFNLHWNGSSVAESPNPQGHAVEDMRAFELKSPEGPKATPPRYLFESVRIAPGDKLSEEESPSSPSLLHLVTPIGEQPTFLSLTPGVPMYNENQKASSLGFLRLGADESALWGAADPASVGKLEGAEVTIVRYSREGVWSQPLGPSTDPPGGNPFTKFPSPQSGSEEEENEQVTSIAPDHSGEGAWLALTSVANGRRGAVAPALVAHISSSGAVAERQSLPSAAEVAQGVGAKGAAAKIACAAADDCWLATTTGYLFHLSHGESLERDAAFDRAYSSLITTRPADAGIPQVVPDAPPVDNSGLLGEAPPTFASPQEAPSVETQATTPVALLSHVRTRLVHRTTLELSFHLAVRARVRLVAMRRKRVVARTATHVFEAGDRKLLLALNVRQWPTKLDLQTHALAPLPSVSLRGAATTTVGTGLQVLPTTPAFNGPGLLP